MKNNNKIFIFSVLFFLLTTMQLAVAEEIALKPDHPQRYVVQKGDTLWDISNLYLKDPWIWPEVWHINPQVINTHLIFPGDKLSLISVEGQQKVTFV